MPLEFKKYGLTYHGSVREVVGPNGQIKETYKWLREEHDIPDYAYSVMLMKSEDEICLARLSRNVQELLKNKHITFDELYDYQVGENEEGIVYVTSVVDAKDTKKGLG